MAKEDNIFSFGYISDNHSEFFKKSIVSSQLFILCDHSEFGPCLLLTKRTAGISFGGEMVPPGGKRDPGEKNQSTARRETKDEINLKANNIHKFGKICNPFGHEVNLYYSYINEEKLKSIRHNKNEVDSVYLVPLKVLRNIEPTEVIKHFNFNPKIHKEKLEESKGFSVKGYTLEIEPSDMHHIAGKKPGNKPEILRPFAYFELERVLLSQLDANPELKLADLRYIKPCENLNIEKYEKPIKQPSPFV